MGLGQEIGVDGPQANFREIGIQRLAFGGNAPKPRSARWSSYFPGMQPGAEMQVCLSCGKISLGQIFPED